MSLGNEGSSSDDATRPRISVVVVTYNSTAVIRDCLAPLAANSDIELIVVDNASIDDTLDMVLEVAPSASVIRNSENQGFGAAVNLGAAQATGRVIVLLNPDARASSHTLIALADVLEQNPSVGIVAPLVVAPQDEFPTVAAGDAPTKWRMFTHATGLSRLGARFPLFDGIYRFRATLPGVGELDVDWVSGACLVVRKKDWTALGGLTDRWFMYGEDVELCLRMRADDKRVVIAVEHSVEHAIGGSSSDVDGRMNTAWITNLFDLYAWRLSGSRIDATAWKSIVVAGFYSRALAFVLLSIHPTKRTRAKWEIRRYRSYARALIATRSTGNREPLQLGRSRSAS